jgi:hypothetical protein
MTSRAACRAKRRTNPWRGEAPPRAFSGGTASDLEESRDGSVAITLSNRRRRAASELLGLRVGRSLRHHFQDVVIILGSAAAHGG